MKRPLVVGSAVLLAVTFTAFKLVRKMGGWIGKIELSSPRATAPAREFPPSYLNQLSSSAVPHVYDTQLGSWPLAAAPPYAWQTSALH